MPRGFSSALALRTVAVIGSWASLVLTTGFWVWIALPGAQHGPKGMIEQAMQSAHGYDYVLSVWTYLVDVLILVANNAQARMQAKFDVQLLQLMRMQSVQAGAQAVMLERMNERDKADARDIDEILAFVREIRDHR